jgi:hypothetical protein
MRSLGGSEVDSIARRPRVRVWRMTIYLYSRPANRDSGAGIILDGEFYD